MWHSSMRLASRITTRKKDDMDAQVYQGSLGEILAKLGALAPKAAPEATEEEWRMAMMRSTQDIAHDILKNVEDLPLLTSVNSAGTATFIVCETQNVEFTITVAVRRKVEPTNEPTFTFDKGDSFAAASVTDQSLIEKPGNEPKEELPDRESERCQFCGGFHRRKRYLPTEQNIVTADNDMVPNPAVWGGASTKTDIEADERNRAAENRAALWTSDQEHITKHAREE